MLKRLVVGLVKGLVVGGLAAAALVAGLGVTSFGALIGYPAAVATGALVGLIAGKPIWAADAKIEALLKALVGAGIGAALLLLLRKWLAIDLDLSAYGLGHGAVGELPAAALPAIAGGLAAFFELDNTEVTTAGGPKKARVAEPKQRVGADTGAEAEAGSEAEGDAAATKKARR